MDTLLSTRSRIQYWRLSLIAIGILLLFPISASAQTPEAKLFVLSDPRDGEIALRWGPTDYSTLELATNQGYRIERQELTGRGNNQTIVSTVVMEESLRPYPIPAWKPLTDTSDYAKSIASILYVQEPITTPNDQAFAHGIALFSADIDFAAASAGGLGYTDRTVKAETTYRYVISVGSIRGAQTVDSDVRIKRPPPQEATGDFQQFYVDLSWNRAKTDRSYTSYDVRRSADGGKTYTTVNTLPLVQILNDQNYDTLQYYRDTLPDLETTYHYQIIGTTPFGRHGPPSDPVIGRAMPDARELMPRITEMTLDVEENYRISWEVPRRSNRQAVEYEVFSSRTGYTGYESRSGRIPATETYWIEQYPVDGHFYRIHAYDAEGYTYVSNPRLMLVDDTDPPTPPPGIEGKMDSLGVVTLSWKPSTEDDVKGYRVTFSNRPDGYFAQLTSKETTALLYQDQVTMDTRAEDVYYRVFAVDYAGNYSEESEPVKVSRPDLKPPTPPVFREIGSDENAVLLPTALSSSDDVVYHLFQRNTPDTPDWTTLDTLRSTASTYRFRDTEGKAGQTYRYRVVAVDDAGLQSMTDPINAARTDTGLRGTIENFRVRVLTTSPTPAVSWSYPPAGDLEGFQLYRSENGADLQAYRLLNATTSGMRLSNGTFTYLDRETTPGTRYTYKLLARHRDGGYSPFTPALDVQLPN